jgi:ubiquinone biosynthesis protein UbiJ
MLVNNFITVGQLAAAATAIISFILVFMKYIIAKPLDKRIIEVTKQIQPDANGGKSLADVALGVARVERKVENVIKRVDRLEKKVI